jgi:hypothetical protein
MGREWRTEEGSRVSLDFYTEGVRSVHGALARTIGCGGGALGTVLCAESRSEVACIGGVQFWSENRQVQLVCVSFWVWSRRVHGLWCQASVAGWRGHGAVLGCAQFDSILGTHDRECECRSRRSGRHGHDSVARYWGDVRWCRGVGVSWKSVGVQASKVSRQYCLGRSLSPSQHPPCMRR